MAEEEKYMTRCIQLAKHGQNHVAPNPMVGAVIVYKDRIIGEGYHIRCGEAHAEVNAINSVADQSLLKNSTIYVSLEPCAHYGKTPPCADLIIKKQIPRVVVGCQDPFSEVAGRGIQMLRAADVDVKVGVLENECRNLINRFITFNILKRPYVILKWAESADGYLDVERTGGSPVVLSTSLTNMLVHKRRSEVDAIMVGTRTAELDNPSLTVRNWIGRNPLRIVIDEDLRLSSELNLFMDGVSTVCFTAKKQSSREKVDYVQIDFQQDVLSQILSVLYKKGVQSLMVEGGSRLLQSVINAGLWDEAFVEKSTVCLNSGVKAPVIKGIRMIDKLFGIPIVHYYSHTSL